MVSQPAIFELARSLLRVKMSWRDLMHEKDFYQERRETKQARLACPHCRQRDDFKVRWLVREKREKLPSGASTEDRQRFAQVRSYMVREDEHLFCSNPRCRKRFEIPSQQSVVLL